MSIKSIRQQSEQQKQRRFSYYEKQNIIYRNTFTYRRTSFAGCGQTGNTTGNTSSTTAGQETATTEQTDSTAQTASDSTASTNDIFTNMDTTDIDGNKMDSSIFAKNKVTLVNVWNVGCTPCVNEIPDLDKINSEYKDKGAAVYGLYGDLGMGISDDEMAQIKDIMSNANASYTQLRMDGTLATNESLLNIMAYPTTYVVGSDGTILDTIEGSKDYEGWKALIDSYLAEQSHKDQVSGSFPDCRNSRNEAKLI